MRGFYNHDIPPINIPLCFYKHLIGCLAHKGNDLPQQTKLSDLAHSGQFKGKTWLPYTRIAQYMELIAQFSFLFSSIKTPKFKNDNIVQ